MQSTCRLLFLSMLLIPMAACQQQAITIGPKPEEMRTALLTLMETRPDIAIPEFKISLEVEKPVVREGIVHIGAWYCDPQLMTFEALFPASNISMYEISGRFERDARGRWVAKPRRVLQTEKHDIGEFWRPNEVDTH